MSKRIVLPALLLIAVFFSFPCHAEDGWISLFDGTSLDGWTQLNGTATYKVEDGTIDSLRKKEALSIRREGEKLKKYLGGIKMMDGLPAVLFVVDPQNEHIAVNEARKLHIPIVALTDTNCDPDLIDFVIPGNDDAMRAIKLYAEGVADAVRERFVELGNVRVS